MTGSARKAGDGADMLATLVAERPRLMATSAALARTRDILQRNPTAQQWQKEVAKQADIILPLPPLTPDWVHDAKETAAAPLPLVRSSSAPAAAPADAASRLEIARLFGTRILTLGLMWLLTADGRYRDRAKGELLAMCAFPEWAGDEFLVTAETAFGAAIGYDWLYDALSEADRAQVVTAILDKAIQPGLDQFAAAPPPPQHWMTSPTNWSLVCCGGLMIAALAVAEADPRAVELFGLGRAAVRAGFNGYDPDGGWAEGPGYWHYATQYAIYLLDSMTTALGTTLGLDAAIGLSQTGLFRLHVAGPSGKLFNFSDSEEKHSGGYWLFWLARRYDHPVDAWIEDHRGSVHPMDLLWFDDAERPPNRLPTARRFRGVEVATLRGGWDRADTYVAFKGGRNDSGRHAQYDLGSFVVDAGGVRWAIDLGPDNYGLPGYFDPMTKASYYRTSTIGHNTLVIDGQSQPASAHAIITRHRFGARLSLVVMDLSEAYPSTVRVLRGVALIARRHVLIVDEICPNEPIGSIAWQMHARAGVALGDPVTALSQPARDNGAAPVHCYLRVIEPERGTLSVVAATPSGPPGQDPNDGVAKLVFRLRQIARPVRIAVLLSADRGACANPKLPAAVQAALSEWAQPTRAGRR